MSRLTDLIQQARQGKRICEMLPIEGSVNRPSTTDAIPDALVHELATLELLLPTAESARNDAWRLLCHELDDLADLLRLPESSR